MTSTYIAVRNGNLGDIIAEREVTTRSLGESPEGSRIVIAAMLQESVRQVCAAYGIA